MFDDDLLSILFEGDVYSRLLMSTILELYTTSPSSPPSASPGSTGGAFPPAAFEAVYFFFGFFFLFGIPL